MVGLDYARDRMLRDLEAKGIRDQRVLEAMRAVPRHDFVDKALGARAYKDYALRIGEGQTISAPWIVARMTELLELEKEHSVLEIGTGSGYQTAVLAQLARVVYSIERVSALARQAVQRIQALGFDNVKIQVFDGSIGFSDRAPYDRILVTAGAPDVPPPLIEQLAPRGRMVIPVGEHGNQRLVLLERDAWGAAKKRVGEAVSFVPLLGRHGFERPGGEGT